MERNSTKGMLVYLKRGEQIQTSLSNKERLLCKSDVKRVERLGDRRQTFFH